MSYETLRPLVDQAGYYPQGSYEGFSLHMPLDDVLAAQVVTAGNHADIAFTGTDRPPYLVRSQFETIDFGHDGLMALASIEFDLTESAFAGRYPSDEKRASVLADFVRNKLEQTKSDLIFPTELGKKIEGSFTLEAELLPDVTIDILFRSTDSYRGGVLTVAAPFQGSEEQPLSEFVYVAQHVASIWAACHNPIASLRKIGDESSWKSGPEKVRLTVGTAEELRVPYAEIALLSAIDELTAMLDQLHASPAAVPYVGELESVSIHTAEQQLKQYLIADRIFEEKLTDMMSALVKQLFHAGRQLDEAQIISTDLLVGMIIDEARIAEDRWKSGYAA